jgi:hypothetical protein
MVNEHDPVVRPKLSHDGWKVRSTFHGKFAAWKGEWTDHVVSQAVQGLEGGAYDILAIYRKRHQQPTLVLLQSLSLVAKPDVTNDNPLLRQPVRV